MLLAGDEFGRTQKGNNNAYCQDNEISWVDWNFGEKGAALVDFVQMLTALRRKYPILRFTRFLTGTLNEELGVKDVAWISATGAEMKTEEWSDGNTRCFGMLLDGRAQPTGVRQRGQETTLLLVFNGWHDVVKFTLPQGSGGGRWSLLLDTNISDEKGEPAEARRHVLLAGDEGLIAQEPSLGFLVAAEKEEHLGVRISPRRPFEPGRRSGIEGDRLQRRAALWEVGDVAARA